ncbi:hypothetical protein ACFE04_025555 [Oxalis oulophora]
MGKRLVTALIFPLVALLAVVEGVWLTIPSSGTKCVSEDIQNNVVVLADYYVVDEIDGGAHNSLVSARVTSPYGNNLHHNENVTHGQFAFTTTEAGNYLACFWMDKNHQRAGGELTLSLEWRIGVFAKDWESVARKEKIEGVELELRKLEGLVQAIRENIVYLKHREDEEVENLCQLGPSARHPKRVNSHIFRDPNSHILSSRHCEMVVETKTNEE